ncbi:hypothetical protein ABZ723_15790 [Streptomyces sp. NPDC006700]|uniref:hypothetical protein n=1 Tax=unclassified Streptomyces TaxID=2593676 RepID=UPI0034012113
MPRIRVLEAIAGADFSWAPGDVVEVSEEAAASWADGHRAVLADDDGSGSPAQAADGERIPLVLGEDGQELEVVDAVVEDCDPPDGEDGGLSWSRWSVTVRLPVPPVPDPEEPGDPAEPGDVDDQEAEVETPLFDPSEHSNREVLAYLDGVGEREALRVLDAEAAGQNRAGISKAREQVLEAARARDAAAGGRATAADYSRGGGRADAPETRDW